MSETKSKKFFVRLPCNLYAQLQFEARRRGEATSVIMREALHKYFARRQSQPSVEFNHAGEATPPAAATHATRKASTPKSEKVFVRLPPSLHEKLQSEAGGRGEAASLIMREALHKYFARRQPQPPLDHAGETTPPACGLKPDITEAPPMTVPPIPANDPRRLAVTEAEAIALLGLDRGRSAKAAKHAFYNFRLQHRINKLPGGVFSMRKLEAAASGI